MVLILCSRTATMVATQVLLCHLLTLRLMSSPSTIESRYSLTPPGSIGVVIIVPSI